MPDAPPRGILITRPAADAAATAERVRRLGFEPVVAPVSVLHGRTVAPTGRFDAIVITSRNAVPALPPHLRAVPLLAVGSATAARAREAGFSTILDAQGDGAALAGLAARRLGPGARILFAHGYRQGDAVADALVTSGFAVVRACAYSVEPARRFPEAAAAALDAGTLRTATFLSTETAAAFTRLLPPRLRPAVGGIRAVAIGAGAAQALSALRWSEVRTAFKPTLDDVLALL